MEAVFKQLHRWETLEPRYLTCSCYRRLRLFNNPAIRDAFAGFLRQVRERSGMRLIAWVLMPEHFHIILIPTRREWPVPKILVSLKQPLAQSVIRRWRTLRAPVLPKLAGPRGTTRFWQPGGGFDRNPRTPFELSREIAYIHMNPVRRGLVKSPAEWAWSSARWYAGDRAGCVPIDPCQ